MKRFQPTCEQFEPRMLPTLVFVFNGNAFAASKPDRTTHLAADQLVQHGDRAIQLPTPAMDSPAVFYQLANEVRRMSRGQPIGLMGFSAGGALAMRLAGLRNLNVKAVMNYYGPPDFRDWLAYHRGDRYFQSVTSHFQVTPGFVRLMSGPSATQAYIVNAFGLRDQTVVSSISTSSFDRDFQQGQVYYYRGPHGVTLYACYRAFADFLAHL